MKCCGDTEIYTLLPVCKEYRQKTHVSGQNPKNFLTFGRGHERLHRAQALRLADVFSEFLSMLLSGDSNDTVPKLTFPFCRTRKVNE